MEEKEITEVIKSIIDSGAEYDDVKRITIDEAIKVLEDNK